MPDLVMDQIIMGQFQRAGQTGLGYTMFGLDNQGRVWRFDNDQNGWIPNSMKPIERKRNVRTSV